MEIFILAALIGLIPAAIARGKGRSFGLWWFYGALLFIVARPHALLLKPDRDELDNRAVSEGNKKCPYCAELSTGTHPSGTPGTWLDSAAVSSTTLMVRSRT